MNAITVVRARENNLAVEVLHIPRQRVTVFTGVSGSGKSSLVFDTIAREGERRFLETLPNYARQVLGGGTRPRVERLTGLSPTIAVDQRATGWSRRSTVGTMSEAYDYLRLLFAKLGVAHCPRCGTSVEALSPDQIADRAIGSMGDRLALICAPLVRDGSCDDARDAIDLCRHAGFVRLRVNGVLVRCDDAGVSPQVDSSASKPQSVQVVYDRLRISEESRGRFVEAVEKCALIAQGLVVLVDAGVGVSAETGGDERQERIFSTSFRCVTCETSLPSLEPKVFSFNSPSGACGRCGGLGTVEQRGQQCVCSDCSGRRLSPEALAVQFEGRSIDALAGLAIDELDGFLGSLTLDGAEARIALPVVAAIQSRLETLSRIGLGYLSLARSAATLSSGEAQRVRLATRVGSTLHGVTLILDEPTAGLHVSERQQLMGLIEEIRQRGNTILLVEHDLATMRSADYVVDLGPGAGPLGGRVVATGTIDEIAGTDSSRTGAFLAGRSTLSDLQGQRGTPERWIELSDVSLHNFKGIDVRLPLERFVAVTGVSGAGKSTLLHGVVFPAVEGRLAGRRVHPRDQHCRRLRGVEALEGVVEINQTPMVRRWRSHPASFLRVISAIRSLFVDTPLARARGYGSSQFNADSKDGQCVACRGAGTTRVDMRFLPAIKVVCDVCGGRRFNAETLMVTYRGRSIADVLAMTAREAIEFFHDHPVIVSSVRQLDELDLGYLALGQPLSTLSGGEAQRLRLARALGQSRSTGVLYLLDEPTGGLHFDDVRTLVAALQRLVDQGNSVVVVEHNPDVILAADWIVDVGPGAGDRGGTIVVSGSPRDVACSATGQTADVLKNWTVRRADERKPTPPETRPDPPEAMQNEIAVDGASQHNLKSIDVRIPHHSLTVVTGVSGSGKSSLAFDTVFAEGQRQYIQALSTSARRFLSQLERPKVKRIDGLLPAVAVDQQALRAPSPYSTVGTVTDVYDFLRLLFARAGQPHCPVCDERLEWTTPADLTADLIKRHPDSKGYVGSPVVFSSVDAATRVFDSYLEQKADLIARQRESGESGVIEEFLEARVQEGYSRLLVDGEEMRLDPPSERHANAVAGALLPTSGSAARRHVGLVVDRVLFNPESASRIADALQRGFAQSGGFAFSAVVGGEVALHARFPACPRGHFSFDAELSPAEFSFSGPRGACPTCRGRGTEAAGRSQTTCSQCQGRRLRPESLAVRIDAKTIADVATLSLAEACEWVRGLDKTLKAVPGANLILDELSTRLQTLCDLGVGYLTIGRGAGTLSGGEAQRLRLAARLGNGLVDVLYVLDEPTFGLHPRDTDRLITKLERLRDLGNTVVVVEHDRDVIERADWLLDLGPGAGVRGGAVVAAGTPSDIRAAHESVTGAYLRGDRLVWQRRQRRSPTGQILLRGVRKHNLNGIDVDIPTGVLCGVSGVSGCGKSTLVVDVLAPCLHDVLERRRKKAAGKRRRRDDLEQVKGVDDVDRVVTVDQAPIGKSPRSNPATVTGIWSQVRKFFAVLPSAKVKGFGPERFGFNRPGGRCEHCKGDGSLLVEMHFLPDVWVPCDVCGGKRFDRETLSVRYRGANVGDLLELDVDAALELFENHAKIATKLRSLADIGLGYLTLGQGAHTLSGGEAQRLKLAAELGQRRLDDSVVILDEPTSGLHFEDVRVLLELLDRIVARGASIIVVEHNLDVLSACDWLIDLGPEGGMAGGTIVAEGTPEDVARVRTSHTGAYLRERL